MKKVLILLFLFSLFGCATWHENWALEEGWLPPDSIPEVVEPEDQPLPHPIVPELILDETNIIPSLMNHVLLLSGTVEKFQYLVEIYEREYLNIDGYSNSQFKNKTLEELRQEYLNLLGVELSNGSGNS